MCINKTAGARTLEAFFNSGGSWTTKQVGAHSAILVRHPQGAFLFDTGIGNNVDEQSSLLLDYDKRETEHACLVGFLGGGGHSPLNRCFKYRMPDTSAYLLVHL